MEENGVWRTVGGKRVFIADGDTLENAMVKSGKFPLSSEERKALIKYVSTDFKKINNYLRYGDGNDDALNEQIKQLDRALNKMPEYQGIVKRSVNISDEKQFNDFINNHEIDSVVTYKEYISSDKETKFRPNAKIQMTINSKKGKDVSKFNASENEVVFKRNTSFKVKSMAMADDNKTYLYILEEQ